MRQCGKIFVEPDRPQMTILRMRIACWIPKATRTHCNNGHKNASQYYVICTLPVLSSPDSTCQSVKKRTNVYLLYIVAVHLSHNSSPPWRYTVSWPGDRRTSFSSMALHFKDFSINYIGLSGFDLSNTWVVALGSWIQGCTRALLCLGKLSNGRFYTLGIGL